MLELHDLRAGYGGPPVLRELSARLTSGLAHGIVGRNGSGKTTLLRVLSGLLEPENGRVSWTDSDSTQPAARVVAFLPSEPFFYPWTTAVEHLLVCRPVGSDFDPRAWCELLEVPTDRAAETFSDGMKRRLGLLACIALDRPVLALDEPFNNLDAESSHLVSGILKRLAERGRTLLVTSHVPGSLEQICDVIHWLHGGRFEESYTRDRFSEMPARVFGALHEERLERLGDWLGEGRADGIAASQPPVPSSRAVVYIVSVRLDGVAAEKYEAYMREKHIPEIASTGCFRSIEFERVEPMHYRTRYTAPDRTALDRYLSEHAPSLRADFSTHFPAGASVSREIVDVDTVWVLGA